MTHVWVGVHVVHHTAIELGFAWKILTVWFSVFLSPSYQPVLRFFYARNHFLFDLLNHTLVMWILIKAERFNIFHKGKLFLFNGDTGVGAACMLWWNCQWPRQNECILKCEGILDQATGALNRITGGGLSYVTGGSYCINRWRVISMHTLWIGLFLGERISKEECYDIWIHFLYEHFFLFFMTTSLFIYFPIYFLHNWGCWL